MSQWSVVFFANDSDQVMTDAAGPFRTERAAIAAKEKLEALLHMGACPQVVRLHTLAEAKREFTVPEEQRYDADADAEYQGWRRGDY